MPKCLQFAFIDIEDERFMDHNGIDLKGILRAGVVAIKNKNLSEGASTITQQLLKNNVFEEGGQESSYGALCKRKFQEQYLALELEKTTTKSNILQSYLNTINLGANTLGVQAAAKRYFNKNASELNISESACIAAITQNPTAFNPITHPEKNAKRRAKVLKNMKKNGHISDAEYEEALADALDAGIIGGAAIDVMCDEPPDVKSRLLQHPKCIVTPHIAAFSCDFEKNFFAASVEKLRQICE